MHAPRWLVVGLLAVGACAGAQTAPAGLADLLRQSDDRAQQELGARGYALMASDLGPQRSWQYWWHRRDGRCAQLVLVRGRVESIASTIETDCDQASSLPWKQSSGGRTAMAAARAAGVDALLHKTHERDVRRYNDVGTIADFERGYRVGLQEQAARDARDTSAFADGLQAGQRKRLAAWHTRPVQPLPPGAGAAPPPLAALVGARESQLEPALKAHGFQRHTGFSKGNETYSSWLRPSDRLCIQTVSVNGFVSVIGEPSEQGCI